MIRYLVVDCPFNQQWAKDLIGRTFKNPPSYTAVVPYLLRYGALAIQEAYALPENRSRT